MSTRRAHIGRRPAQPDAARLAAVLAALPEGVVLFDSHRRVVLTNPAYDRLMAGAEARPGDTTEAVIRARIAAGEYGPGDPEAQLARHLSYDFSLPRPAAAAVPTAPLSKTAGSRCPTAASWGWCATSPRR